MSRLIALLLMLALASGCSKDPDPVDPGSAPTVEIQSPAPDGTVTGPTIPLQIVVTGEPLALLHVFILRADTETLLFGEQPGIDNPSNFLYNRAVSINLDDPAPLLLNVVAEGVNGRRANLTVAFTYVP